MTKSNGEIIQEKFSPHQFGITCNEDGYSDVEVLIDGRYSGIWIDDWMWYEDEESDLKYLAENIERYLSGDVN